MSVTLGPLHLEQSYAAALPELSLPRRAAAFPEPRLVVLDEPLACELGIDTDWLRADEGVAALVGAVPESVPTVAQAYAGHQFGGWSPRLGDGRALLLGEVHDRAGRRRDVHLKGSGRTPFGRGADGKAALGPMLREHLMGVAMHALGIPTTRALAVCTTGERVMRDGMPPGAVLTRVAASHLRFGTFQYAAAAGDRELLERLTAYAIERHWPTAAEASRPALALLEHVADAHALLVARWLEVGFIHGVMNTDNMTISGETLDYGPCAFMDAHDARTVFSSIDTGGRYSYGNQPAIAQWNLARLAESLLPLIDDDTDTAVELATGVLSRFATTHDEAVVEGFSRKLGLPEPDRDLVTGALDLLRTHRVDHTRFFRLLADGSARELFDDIGAYDAWADRRAAALGAPETEVAATMNAVNPLYVPRNHVVEAALAAATAGDLAPYERLVAALRTPYEPSDGMAELEHSAPEGSGPHITYCGT